MKALFAEEPVNRGRQPELDIAKALLVFFLAFIHCTIECTPEEGLTSGIPYLFDTVIGGPLAAPMFMFAMGIGMVYSGKDSAGAHAIRGVCLVLQGFVLNLCRYTAPFLLGFAITADAEKYMEPLLYRTLCWDMLQFAGLAMLLIVLLKRLRVPDRWMLALALGMSLLGTRLNGVDAGSPFRNIFLGCFVGTEDAAGMVLSDFPLLNWFFVPAAGYVFGERLIRVKEKGTFYRLLSPAALAVTAAWFATGICSGRGMFGEGENCYYHIRTDDMLVSVAAAIALLGVYYFLSDRIPKQIMTGISAVSRNVTYVYCIHWVLVTLTINVALYAVRGTQVLPVPQTMLLSLVISIAAILISVFLSPGLPGRRKDGAGAENGKKVRR